VPESLSEVVSGVEVRGWNETFAMASSRNLGIRRLSAGVGSHGILFYSIRGHYIEAFIYFDGQCASTGQGLANGIVV
jgi:hypothetical protein